MLVALSMSIRTSHPTLPHPSFPPLSQGRLPIYIFLILFNHRCPRPDVVMGEWGTKNEKKKLTYEGGGVENSGGEEVLLDVGGQDATEAFEDVGHSDEAREILEKLLIGDLKRVVC